MLESSLRHPCIENTDKFSLPWLWPRDTIEFIWSRKVKRLSTSTSKSRTLLQGRFQGGEEAGPQPPVKFLPPPIAPSKKWGRWKWRTWNCRTWNWRTKLQGMKLQDMKMADKIAGHENARHENAWQEIARQEITGRENTGHEIARHLELCT